MISKQYFEETFSLATAQALQAWANNNLITPTLGDYAMKIEYAVNGGALVMFAETELVGLTVGDSYTVRGYVDEILSNSYKIYINELPNDNTSTIAGGGYGLGWREATFTATATTMYLAIGDDNPALVTYSTIDSISVKDGTGTNFVTNGTFEANNTDGWYGQSVNTVLSIYAYASTPPADNPYLEEVNIPAYDAGNPEHFLITDNSGWNEINNTSYTNFYVEPGDYTSKDFINLTADGTSVKKRTISLYNSNDTHPAQLASNESMQFLIRIYGSYWVIDRPSALSPQSYVWYYLKAGSTNNIINRMYTDTAQYVLGFEANSETCTVQNSFFADRAGTGDNAPILFSGSTTAPWSAPGHKIISNDFRNHNDALHVANQGTIKQIINLEGLIIYDNNMWITDALYTDGSGNLDPNGTRAFAENAIDIKGGSTNASNPILIQKNNMWGYRESDTTGLLSDRGAAIITHYGVEYVDILDNVIFDSAGGIATGDKQNRPADFINSKFNNNIVSDCGDYEGAKTAYSFGFTDSSDFECKGNSIINPRDGTDGTTPAFSRFVNSSTIDYQDNKIVNRINPLEIRGCTGVTNTNNIEYADEASAGLTEDYSFYYERYTATPQLMTLTNVLAP